MSNIPPLISSPIPAPLEPVAASARHQTLDVLRGFALFGILMVNMALFSWPLYRFLLSDQGWATATDEAADWVVRFLAEGKFYPLFSFLFGAGIALQMQRIEARAGRFVRHFCRRLFVLLGIGLAHAFLIWEGDILIMYAVCGFLVIPFRNRKPKTLLVWATLCLFIPLGIYVLVSVALAGGSLVPEIATIIDQELAAAAALYARETEENLRIFAHGSFGEIFVQRAKNVGFVWQYAWVYAPVFFAMFLLGLYAARRGILQDPETHAGFIRRTAVWGLIVGLPANAIYAFAFALGEPLHMDWLWVVGMGALAFGGPALCLAYAAMFTLLLRRERWKIRLQPIAAAGRMALTNYLLQSLVATTIFYSYGLGLYGSAGRAAGLGVAVLIYAAQVLFSVWWLRRFRFGPAEWVWRSLTYGTRQPMRLRPEQQKK